MATPPISNQGQPIRFIVKRQQRQAQYFSEDLGKAINTFLLLSVTLILYHGDTPNQ
jgi:hypothetical protein